MENLSRNELLKEVLKNKEVKELINENEISKDIIDTNLNILLAYTLRIKKCNGCKNLENCLQANTGYKPSLSFDASRFDLNYVPCEYLCEKTNTLKKERNLKISSSGIGNHNLNDIYVNTSRSVILNNIKNCINNYEQGLSTKGLYIHGKHGTGKSYLLAYICRILANNDHTVYLAYYPDLAREFRSAINNGTLEDVVEELKKVEVLALDDFGGETMTAYIRDEVIGSILHDRMCEGKLTFIASNLDEKLLINHLQDTGKDIDQIKAARIYERIRALMEFTELTDKNYRD